MQYQQANLLKDIRVEITSQRFLKEEPLPMSHDTYKHAQKWMLAISSGIATIVARSILQYTYEGREIQEKWSDSRQQQLTCFKSMDLTN